MGPGALSIRQVWLAVFRGDWCSLPGGEDGSARVSRSAPLGPLRLTLTASQLSVSAIALRQLFVIAANRGSPSGLGRRGSSAEHGQSRRPHVAQGSSLPAPQPPHMPPNCQPSRPCLRPQSRRAQTCSITLRTVPSSCRRRFLKASYQAEVSSDPQGNMRHQGGEGEDRCLEIFLHTASGGRYDGPHFRWEQGASDPPGERGPGQGEQVTSARKARLSTHQLRPPLHWPTSIHVPDLCGVKAWPV